MQQKHSPFKTKSSYGKIVYLANKIQSYSFIFVVMVSAHPSWWSSRLPRAPWNVCRRFQLEQGWSRHKVGNIWRKPNKDQARRPKKETKSHPAKNGCHWRSPLSSPVVQVCPHTWRNAKVADFSRHYWKSENPKDGKNRRWIDLKKYGFGSGIKCRGKKVTNYSVIKTLVKRLAAWQASVHWKTMREVTKQNNNRYHLSSALLSSNRFGIPVQFSPVCPFSTTIQRLQHAKQSTTFMVASWR